MRCGVLSMVPPERFVGPIQHNQSIITTCSFSHKEVSKNFSLLLDLSQICLVLRKDPVIVLIWSDNDILHARQTKKIASEASFLPVWTAITSSAKKSASLFRGNQFDKSGKKVYNQSITWVKIMLVTVSWRCVPSLSRKTVVKTTNFSRSKVQRLIMCRWSWLTVSRASTPLVR